MKDDPLYEFFHGFSRIFIVIPIVILIVGLFIRFNQNSQKNQSYIASKKTLPSAAPALTNKTTKLTNAEINLKGPFVCQFSSKEATVSGYIKDNKAYGKIEKQSETTNVLLNDDCLYIWERVSYAGEKICGLKPYISMIGSLPLATVLGKSSIIPIKTDMISSILNSCKKEEVRDEKIFEVPKGVKFIQSTRSIFPRN